MGCGKQEQADTEKPVKELTAEEKKVVGEYEQKEDGNTYKSVYLDNGILESYANGKKQESEFKWSIVDGEIHVNYNNGCEEVYRINKDKSITRIAIIEDGERAEFPKEEQHTYKINK